MDETNHVYIIPANYTDSGRLMNGMFETRNAIEAVFVLLLLGLPIFKLLPVAMTVKIVLFVLFVLPVTVFALIGIDGDSLSQYILRLFKYNGGRRKLHLKRICYHYGVEKGEGNGKKTKK